jgi:phosphonate transport system permease protein
MAKKKNLTTNFKDELLKKKFRLSAILVLLVALYIFVSIVIDFNTLTLVKIYQGFIWLAKNFLPNSQSIVYWKNILSELWATFAISVLATTLAALIALFLAILGAKNISSHSWLRWLIRLIGSFFRNIPVIAWALILLFSFKQNNFTGFLALFLMSLGFLIRAFMETIEDFGNEKIQALAVTGANTLQIVFQAILPETVSPLLGWCLYMIENNIRDATLVGIVTGTGIGFLFDLYFKGLNYGAAGLVVLMVAVLVVLVELISNQVMRWIA